MDLRPTYARNTGQLENTYIPLFREISKKVATNRSEIKEHFKKSPKPQKSKKCNFKGFSGPALARNKRFSIFFLCVCYVPYKEAPHIQLILKWLQTDAV